MAVVFGRLITYVGESYSPVRAKRVTWIFVVFDILSFIVQGGGGSVSPFLISAASLLTLYVMRSALFLLRHESVHYSQNDSPRRIRHSNHLLWYLCHLCINLSDSSEESRRHTWRLD